jgi:hypothetical protein
MGMDRTDRSDLIIEINRQSVFSLEEAQELLHVIIRITKSYCEKVEGLIARLDTLPAGNDGLATSLETQVNSLISEWQAKVQKLGALPKGLWIADFDSGEGYYCWKYPERRIEFWHKYTDGFSKRMRVAELAPAIPLHDRLRQKVMSSISPLRPTEITE